MGKFGIDKRERTDEEHLKFGSGCWAHKTKCPHSFLPILKQDALEISINAKRIRDLQYEKPHYDVLMSMAIIISGMFELSTSRVYDGLLHSEDVWKFTVIETSRSMSGWNALTSIIRLTTGVL